jgi:hypothetical protein
LGSKFLAMRSDSNGGASLNFEKRNKPKSLDQPVRWSARKPCAGCTVADSPLLFSRSVLTPLPYRKWGML